MDLVTALQLDKPRLKAARSPDWDLPLSYNGAALFRLTTPVAYLGEVPADPFVGGAASRPRAYYYRPPDFWRSSETTETLWNLVSMRPYGYFNLTQIAPDGIALPGFGRTLTYVLTSLGPDLDASFTDPDVAFPFAYDPTNGLASRGDLVLPGSQ